MTKKNIIATIALTCAMTIAAGNAQAQKRFSDEEKASYKKAIELADKTNNRTAVDLLRQLYDKHLDNIDLAYNLGICYINMSGNSDSALYFLYRVRELDTSKRWTDGKRQLHMAIGRAQQLCNKPEDALKTYDLLEENDPKQDYADLIAHERLICNNALVQMQKPVKVTVKNVGENINSSWNDYRPVLSANEDTLYFTSRRPKKDANKHVKFVDGQSEEGIYFSVRPGGWLGENKWSKAEQVRGLAADKDGAGQETATCISNYGTEMYIVHDGDIYVSIKDTATGDWGKAERLPEPINSAFDENFAYVTNDGQTMYLSSNSPSGYGEHDIYRARRLPNGKWGEPLNLGPNVNTDGDEDSPVFHEETGVLYFSSTGHNTIGGSDIFYAMEGEDGSFVAAQNIGFPINSTDDDLYFYPSKEHDIAYMASIKWTEENAAPSYNIYEIEYEQPEKNKMAIISASIVALKPNEAVVRTKADGEVVGICKPNPKTGRFVTIVEAGKEYELQAIYLGDTITQVINTSRADSYYNKHSPIISEAFKFTEKDLARSGSTGIGGMGGDYASGSLRTDGLNRGTGYGHNTNLMGDAAEGAEGEGNESASATDQRRSDSSMWRDWLTSDEKPYTVQILCMRKHIVVDKIKGVETSGIAEYVYKDGWYVYSYGAFATYREALVAKDEIRRKSEFKDAFVRIGKQYKKYIIK